MDDESFGRFFLFREKKAKKMGGFKNERVTDRDGTLSHDAIFDDAAARKNFARSIAVSSWDCAWCCVCWSQSNLSVQRTALD